MKASETIQEMTEAFNRKYGYEVDVPLDPQVILFRIRLISEEFAELVKAFALRDVVEIADALADLNYVVHGTAGTFGFPLDALTAEVHRSNMTKEFDRHANKPVKGHGFQRPLIEKVLRENYCGRLVAE